MVQADGRRPLVTGQCFIPSKARIVFTVDRMTMGQVSLRVLRVSLVSVILSMFLLSSPPYTVLAADSVITYHTYILLIFGSDLHFGLRNVRLEQEKMVLGHTTTYNTLKTFIKCILRTHYVSKYP